MKALILAGGYATRLRPLSCQKPKLLFPVAGRPIIERTIEALKKAGVDEVVLAVNYLADVLESHLKSEYAGVKITYSRDPSPLGTAGPIKLAEKVLKGSDPFLAFNGDILFETDLKEMVALHRERRAVATIALREVDEPSRFGVVVLNGEMRVREFVEKPKKEEAPSNLINAGIYVMSPQILSYIPPGRRFSSEEDVFPVLAKEKKLYAYRYQGGWFDIGTTEDFRNANRRYLEKISRNEPLIQETASVHGSACLKPPLLICAHSTVEADAEVGPYSVIGSKNTIKEHSVITESILFDDVYVGASSTMRGCTLGDGVYIGDRVTLGRNVVIAEGAKLDSGVKVADDVCICSYREIKEDIVDPGLAL